MRARTVAVTAAAIAAAMLLAACTPAASPLARERTQPAAVPQDLTWQFATTCLEEMTSGETVVSLHWDETGIEVGFEGESPATQRDRLAVEDCFTRYRLERRATGFTFVDAFERAQLWDYYNTVTLPCLDAHGVAVPALTRAQFFVPDQRPWNPYTAMDDLPFDQLLALYRSCPPVPDYLRDRHEP